LTIFLLLELQSALGVGEFIVTEALLPFQVFETHFVLNEPCFADIEKRVHEVGIQFHKILLQEMRVLHFQSSKSLHLKDEFLEVALSPEGSDFQDALEVREELEHELEVDAFERVQLERPRSARSEHEFVFQAE